MDTIESSQPDKDIYIYILVEYSTMKYCEN